MGVAVSGEPRRRHGAAELRQRADRAGGDSEPDGGSRAGSLSTSFCSPVYYDGTHLPRFLVASDLPMQGFGSLALTVQMSDAVR